MLSQEEIELIRADWVPYADGGSPASVAVNALLDHADAQVAAHRQALAGLTSQLHDAFTELRDAEYELAQKEYGEGPRLEKRLAEIAHYYRLKRAEFAGERPAAAPLEPLPGAGEGQVPGMPQAQCHGCGLPAHVARCQTPNCPMK